MSIDVYDFLFLSPGFVHTFISLAYDIRYFPIDVLSYSHARSSFFHLVSSHDVGPRYVVIHDTPPYDTAPHDIMTLTFMTSHFMAFLNEH